MYINKNVPLNIPPNIFPIKNMSEKYFEKTKTILNVRKYYPLINLDTIFISE